MIIFEPVIETADAREFTAWPTATRDGLGWLALSGDLAPFDIGTVMAVIAVYNHDRITPPGKEDDRRPGPAELIERIVQADSLIAPGGIRVRDIDSNLAVAPGCCCGLEDWPEWDQVTQGQSPWLGHDPAPWAEHQGAIVRVWPDGGDAAVPPAGALPIEIPVDDLPRLIADAHKQFRDFLDLLGPWALPRAAASATLLGPILASHFHVSWPTPGDDYPAAGDRHS